MEEQELKLVRSYLDKMKKPSSDMSKYDFDRASYSTWAVEEVLCLMLEETFKPPPIVGGTSTEVFDIIDTFQASMAYDDTWKNEKVSMIIDETLDDLRVYLKVKLGGLT